MNLNEVDRAGDIKTAGNIVKQMFHKKHKVMTWPSDSKPTIRGLIEQLDDPFLLSLTKNLDFFIHYGQAWVNLNANDIFSDKSETSNVNDLMKDPSYFKNKKSTVYKIMQIRPSMYGVLVKHGNNMGNADFTPESNLVDEYALKVLDGSKMPLPYLRYEKIDDERRGEYVSFGQEGRHRATVAQILGATSMPVAVIAGIYPPTANFNDLADFSHNIFTDIKNQ